MKHYDVIIVGGGLAGLTAAIHLSEVGHRVLVFEKQQYPHHKVCGEYVSNEIVPYLEKLGVSLEKHKAVAINTLHLSTVEGKLLETKLPLGGKGISRYAFDNILYQKAVTNGVSFKFQTVVSIVFQKPIFEIVTDENQIFTSNLTIGAYGKRNALDKRLNRNFIDQKSAWLAVKAHYRYEGFEENLVALHNFNGGYGGLSKTENGAVNFCYLVSYKSFQEEKNVNSFNERVVSKNPFLAEFLESAAPVFKEPLTIAQISFHPKSAIEDHMLMCGDTAGLIHPLCGNGMAMAIHSAKIASELIHDYLISDNQELEQLEKSYERQWNKAFKKRLWIGRQLQSLLLNKTMSNLAMASLIKQPWLLQRLIKSTHGEMMH